MCSGWAFMTIDFGQDVDLHHFHPRDTRAVLDEFFRQAREKGYRRLRIVHGKGRSAKKREVLKYLEELDDVEQFGNDGTNWGATVVLLRMHSRC
jgi:DNA-nicking Smr family endonuclease